MASCVSQSIPPVAQVSLSEEKESRCPSSSMGSISCDRLFDQNKRGSRDAISSFSLVADFLPASLTDSFWDTVAQISENNNSKINLNSSEMILTKNFENKLKIQSTYVYDMKTNSFIINKIEYSTDHQGKILLSSNPINPETGRLAENLFLHLFNEDLDIKSNKLNIAEQIPYSVYKKINNEISDLNQFTTFELSQLSKMDSKLRSIKYLAVAKSRRIKNYIVKNMIEDFLYKPVKTILISVFSFTLITSQTNFLDHIVSVKKDFTPPWVAPSIVKMAAQYPTSVQAELVSLMKNINAVNVNLKTASSPNEKTIRIDESDQFSFHYDSKNHKTYFFVTHELDSGSLDAYAIEIQPQRYPALMSYYNLNLK